MMRLEIIGLGEVSGPGAWLQPRRKALIGFIQCGTKVEPQISPLRYAPAKNISRKGPQNCRSLGFARDDKGEGDPLWKAVSEPKNASVQQPLSLETWTSPLSSRAKPRDLRFPAISKYEER